MAQLTQLVERGRGLLTTSVQSGTEFIRSNPIVAGTVVGGTGVLATQSIISRVKRRKRSAPRKRSRKKSASTGRKTRKKVGRKRKSPTHRSPRHKGHKRVSFITKDGRKVNFLVKKKSIKHTHKRRSRR